MIEIPDRERQLLVEIENAFPPDETSEFHALCRQWDAETMSADDRPRYRELIKKRELQNAVRLRALGELADLRGMGLEDLMASLRIVPATP